MTSQHTYTTLFLDIGGVLLTDGWNRKHRKLAADTFGYDYNAMDERHHLTYDTYEVGKISLNVYLERVVFYEPRPFTIEEYKTFMYSCSSPFPQMIDLVCRLKSTYGLKVAVVSNEGRELTEYRIKQFKLGKFVDFFISSCFVHFRKPDEDIFQMALNIAQVSAEEVIYLEDRPMFVEVAQKLGIKGIHHTDYTTTKELLAGFGLV